MSSSVDSGDLSSSHFPLCWPVVWPRPGIVKHNNPDYYNNIRYCTWPQPCIEWPDGLGQIFIHQVKQNIFSAQSQGHTASCPADSVTQWLLVSCVTGHFYGEKNYYIRAMFTAFKTERDRAEKTGVTWTVNLIIGNLTCDRSSVAQTETYSLKEVRIYGLFITSG